MEDKTLSASETLSPLFFIKHKLLRLSSPKQVIKEIFALADIEINGNRPFDIQVHNEALYTRLLANPVLGLGESYMEGWWDSEDLSACIAKIARANLQECIKPSISIYYEIIKAKFLNLQNKHRSAQVVKEHYELGNDLYKPMLGETMAYTCAYWKDASTLDEAQRAKFDLIAKKMDLKPGMRVLDLGCGWGGFSQHIAQNYGVNVVAVNLSEVQAAYAKKSCHGLPVTVEIHDYRETEGLFDRIISIGLLEHVGAKNYRNFMKLIHRCLKEDGLALVHSIGRDTPSLFADPWITRYIFPGGVLPSPSQIGHSIEGLFVMEDWHNFGADYDTTLMAWFQNFDRHWDKIKANYPDPFYRMWKYYLMVCAGGFRARNIQLWQIVLSKKGIPGGYTSLR